MEPEYEYFQRLQARNSWSKNRSLPLDAIETARKKILTCILTDVKTECSHATVTVIIISDMTQREKN